MFTSARNMAPLGVTAVLTVSESCLELLLVFGLLFEYGPITLVIVIIIVV
jgi:hypothetical protein